MLLLSAPFALAAPTTPTEDFTDNLDGTVTHRITGLTWMRCALGMTWGGTTCSGTASTYTFDQATKLTANFAGRSDWRVPGIAELNTIMEWDGSHPAINNKLFPGTPSSFFWSGSPGIISSGRADWAWIVSYSNASFSNGSTRHDTRPASHAVRLVRGGQPFDPLAPTTPTSDFYDNNDGTVTHLKTGLMWKRCAEGQTWSGNTCTDSALTYDLGTATTLTSSSAGHSDWRIPTVNELGTLVEYQKYRPAINTAIFPNSPSSNFWSGSPFKDYSGYVWVIQFLEGQTTARSGAVPNFVRLVRGGQFFSPLGFEAKTNAAPGTLLTSNALKIAPSVGASSSAGIAISIRGVGSYAINGGAYTTAPGTVHTNDSVTVRLVAGSTYGTSAKATLTVGSGNQQIDGNFTVTTRTALDNQSPSVPTNLTAAANGNGTITLKWSASTDNVGVTAYRIYRNGTLLTSVSANTTYTDTGLSPITIYSYSIATCDAANNCSTPSAETTVTTGKPASRIPISTTPTQDFTDNRDGTVTHNITGLTWMRCAMGMTWTGTTCTGTASTYTWEQATKLSANFAGNSDWRAPSIQELFSIVGCFGAGINASAFPNVPGLTFWSGSPYAGTSDSAWILRFYATCVNFKSNYVGTPVTNLYSVRLVRGGQSFDPLAPTTPTSDFYDNNDGTVTHLKTGLMWKRCAEGQTWSGNTCTGSARTYDWGTATTLTSSSAGHSDWRIPTENELLTIVEYRASNPAINTSVFPNTNASWFWSGSHGASASSDNAWMVDFGRGFVNVNVPTSSIYVRLVREGQFFGPWGFAAQSKVSTNSSATSSALKVFGVFGSGGNIIIAGGQYAINNGLYTASPGTVNPNDTVTIRVTTASSPDTTTRATLTIGTVSGDFFVTTAPDAQPPAVPASLTATSAISPSGTQQVKLTWSASPDNNGVTHYRIYRNGALLAVVKNPATTYTDTQLTSSNQFTFTVQACDAAYNCSPLSSAASVTRTGNASIAPQLSAGAGHSAGIKTDGSLFSWGFNEAGQLGTGASGDPRTAPQRPVGSYSSAFTAVAAGSSHNLAIQLNGSLWTWGGNASGQLGDSTTTSRNTPIQIGTGYTIVAAGSSHSLGIKLDGTLWAWGNNGTGQLGDGTSNDSLTPIQIGTGFYTVSAGTSHTVAIKTDGTLWAWGSNNFGQLGDSTGNDRYSPNLIGSGFTAVAAGAFHTIALKNDGTLWAWGKNDAGQLGDGTTQNRYAPVQVGSDYSVISGALAAGNAHSVALKPDGSLWAWGANASGQLGDGTSTGSVAPKAIEPSTVFTTVAANGNHTLALRPDGTVWSWGSNSSGQLGDGTLASRVKSVLVVNQTVDGALDLMPEVANTIPADKIPPFWVKVSKAAELRAAITVSAADPNKTNYIYVVGYLDAAAFTLVTGSAPVGQPVVKAGETVGYFPVVCDRIGFKQHIPGSITPPCDANSNEVTLHGTAGWDPTKSNGNFCADTTFNLNRGFKFASVEIANGPALDVPSCKNLVNVSPADTQYPSIPLNITATAVGPGQVNLTWNASTDNVGVVHYNIYRGTTPIATLDNVTSYTDSSPQASNAYSYSVTACDAALNCSGQSTPAQTSTPAQPIVILGAGWNLVGNGGSTVMNVHSLFGDGSKVLSVWKWVKTGSTPNIRYPTWAFYTPLQNDGGVAYAASNGFETFTTIASGEGFWVNAKTAFSVPMTAPAWILSSVFAPNQNKALTPGWSLIATGEAQTASAFNKAIGSTPPSAGSNPINLTSLWSWQNSAQRWYFYAPSLDATGGLGAYLNEMNYLDLGSVNFAPTMGFWVNR
jgi:alpha-tubulin suppressor-like RCC1 family protein/fibronectin type 3 domain-containing protein